MNPHLPSLLIGGALLVVLVVILFAGGATHDGWAWTPVALIAAVLAHRAWRWRRDVTQERDASRPYRRDERPP